MIQEVLLGSILGRLRQVFALLVYRNEAGRRRLLNTILNVGEPGGFEREHTAFEQDLVKVEFMLKRELWKQDRAVLETAGYTPPVKRGRVWPQFRSLVPGGYPWHVTQAGAEMLLFALPRAGRSRASRAHNRRFGTNIAPVKSGSCWTILIRQEAGCACTNSIGNRCCPARAGAGVSFVG